MKRPLLIAHDLAPSGAPLALFELAKSLVRLGERPMVVALEAGPLAVHFLDAGIELVHRIDPAQLSFVVANTILTVPNALRFKRFGVPIAVWLHESAHFFRILGIQPERSGLADVDVVLAPSRFQFDELKAFLPAGSFRQLRNLVRQDAFRPAGDVTAYAVSGQWEPRKGQARLLELARLAPELCPLHPYTFTFVGAERPGGDAGIAIDPRHRFLGQIAPESAKREIARSGAVVSCAESETQNLVALEALMAGRPALLSDIEAHRVLARLLPNVFLFDRVSATSFAQGLVSLQAAIADAAAGRAASDRAKALFGEAAFDSRLHELLGVLRDPRRADPDVRPFQDD